MVLNAVAIHHFNFTLFQENVRALRKLKNCYKSGQFFVSR